MDDMDELDIREVYNYFKTKIFLILVIIGLIFIGGNIYSFIKKPMYCSNSKIILVSNHNKGDNLSQGDIQLNQDLVGTYSEILKSRKVLNQVINNLNLNTTYDSLYNSIEVGGVGEKEIITLRVNNLKAREAQNIAIETIDVFIKEVNKIYELDNITVIDEPTLEKVPYNKNFIKDNMIYILVGIVVSFGVVFLMFYFDTTIKSSDVIEEKFGLTVLGIVPKEGKE